MPKVRFVLKEPKAKKETLVYLIFRFNYQRLKMSTNEMIHPKYWNPSTRRARQTRNNSEYSGFNSRLDHLESKMKSSYWFLLNNDLEITPSSLKAQFHIELGIEEKSNKQSLFGFIEKLIEERKSIVKPNTIKKYNSTFKHLKNYSEKYDRTLDFNDITLDFYYAFLKYMVEELMLANNTVGKYIKTIKTFLSEATDRGVNNNLDYKSKRFMAPYEEVDKMYLTEMEIKKIFNLNLDHDKKLDRARDFFILECYLGQRFSDMANLKPEDIKERSEGKMITLRTIKTGEKVAIPLHHYAEQIIKKYKNNFPSPISNQKTNKYLKDIGKLAKIDDSVNVSKKKNGNIIHTKKKKWELITTHTARRSFATNLYLARVPMKSIMLMTGHRTEKSFLGYVRVTAEENAIELMNHPYFSNPGPGKIVKLT